MANDITSPDPRANPDGSGQVVGEQGETSSPAMHPFLEGVPAAMPEGMGRGFFNDREEEAQQSLWATALDTLKQSVAYSAHEYIQTTLQAGDELLLRGTDELEPHRAELTAGIPLHLHDNIMNSLTLVGAKARRQRILEDQETQRRLAQQVGISQSAVQLAAGLIDADLPLMFLTGGTLAAARTAGQVARSAKVLTGSTRLARVAGDAATGVTGGALSGFVVGGIGNVVRDDYDVNDMFTMMLAGAATGGILNPAVNTIFPDKAVWTEAARQEYRTMFRNMETDLQRELADPTSAINRNAAPAQEADASGPIPRGPVTIELDAEGNSINAASLGTAAREITEDTLGLEAAGAPSSVVERSLAMQNWRQDYGYEDLYNADTANPFVRALVGGLDFKVRIPMTDREVNLGQIVGTLFTLGQRDFTNLVHSRSPSANFVAAEVLESASGLVRKGSSSAVLREMYHSSSMIHSARLIVEARAEYFRSKGLNPARVESHRQFTRDIRLAMDEWYRTGKVPEQFKDVIEGIDKTHKEILGHMRGLDEERSVRGSRDIEHRSGYFRYDWEPRNFLRVRQEVGEDNMVRAFREGYMKGSGLSRDLADKLARAIVRRFSDRGLGIGAADSRLLDIDSRSGIEAVLEQSGLGKGDIDSIMRRLDINTQERVTKGYLRRRVDVDLTTSIPGTNLKLIDLMSDDIERSIQQYVGDAAGAAALAHKGLRDKADVDALIDTIMFEQSALGEVTMTREQLGAIFSQFGGGAHKGYIMGQQTSGVSPVVGMLTKATRASLLQRVGLTQLMDSANVFVSNGVANAMEPVMARLGWNKAGQMDKAQLQSLHSELQSLGVIVGEDHMLFRPHLSIDETELASNVYMQMAQTTLNSVERATNYASGQIHVTQAQQLVASAAVTTNIIRTLAGQETNLTKRMLRDIGLEDAKISELVTLIRSGDITVDGGNVKLNSKEWSDDLRLEFGSAVSRAVHQQVQKGLTGETSVWMNSDIGKLLTSLKTFALTAVQKQTARNLMIGGRQHYLRAATWQLGFAYAVLTLSQSIQGQEMSPVDRARLAVAYTPTMGTIPMVVDPMTTMLGFDDLNFSPYGRYTSYLDTPVFEQTGKLMRGPGALMNMVSGDGDYDDMQNARAMFFMNWYGMKQVWESM